MKKETSFENDQDNQDNQDKTSPNSKGCQPASSMAIYKAAQPPLPRVHLVIFYINLLEDAVSQFFSDKGQTQGP